MNAELLPRELADLSDEIRRMPPPPTPEVPSPYACRLADPDADAELIAEWMHRPHILRNWDQAWPASKWRECLRAQLAGSYSRPFIGSIDGQDHGYVELYRAAKDLVSTQYECDPSDLGVRLAMADLKVLSQGMVLLLLPHFVASVFNAEPQCRRIMFDPHHRNAPLREFCEKGGCVFLGEHDSLNQRRALYVLPRTLDDIPRMREDQ
ncbi:MAG: N-acetyltransferase [Mycobacterium sp.]|uniref:Lysine N-acyltransferase MbtK n=1 Tax=Mycobacterium gordonae TaxID=1778 RepID=A0A1A6BHM8_MYCGO|nr:MULTISPECIES: GNAT family N-acetyltransferase [Mycobacterium]MBI2698653.1 acetyltransferase [Mycobacterium sp.]OBS01838.1 siderophore biosynthesis protein [Mycobacterium gordonae]PJE14536.1 MAG: N-acetyltransferase [Mycobacterium sp.]PJE17006.1 MAG: N-acetyltransferase [Mycobacterium sp.]